MNNNTNNIYKLGCIILIIIVAILSIIIIKNKSNKNVANNNEKSDTSKKIESSLNENDLIRIMLDEDLTKEGTVEGIENLRWSDARIRQDESQMNVLIMLDNKSETEKIPAKDLTIEFLDKENRIIYTKEIKMGEVPDNFGYTVLDFVVDIQEPVMVYDIQIKAK